MLAKIADWRRVMLLTLQALLCLVTAMADPPRQLPDTCTGEGSVSLAGFVDRHRRQRQ